MKTKRIAALLLALIIAFATVPTSALAVNFNAPISTAPISFETAWSVRSANNDELTLIFSEKPIRMIDTGYIPENAVRFFGVLPVFPPDTKVACVDGNGQPVTIFALDRAVSSGKPYRYIDSRYGNFTREITLGADLAISPTGVVIYEADTNQCQLAVTVEAPGLCITAYRDDNPDIMAKTEEITDGLTGERARADAIYRWVTNNIWYDCDQSDEILATGGVGITIPTVQEILEQRRGVCEDYANLTVALLRACDIQAYKVCSRTKVNGGHAWVKAYVDGRWINLDPTWDSNSKYRDGVYGPQLEPDHEWFDTPDATFLLDHDPHEIYRFIDNNNLWPTELAPKRPDVPAAITAGLAPADWQNDTTPITRQEYCHLLVGLIESVTFDDVDALLAEKKVSRDGITFTDTTDPDIVAIKALGVSAGTGPTTFSPAAGLTREQAAILLRRTLKLLNYDTQAMLAPLVDANPTNDEAKYAAYFCYNYDLMPGIVDGKFNPGGAFTRQDAIVMMSRIIG